MPEELDTATQNPQPAASGVRIDPEHPRPTFARASWRSLDGPWQFASGTAGDDPLTLGYDATVQVPFPPESAASGLVLTRCDHTRYRRTFSVDPTAGRRVLLHFEAVDHDARVWVNGHLVGAHSGGYTPFTCDVTDVLVAGENELVVAARDDARDVEQPRGKQDWHDEPHIIWYRRSSGIWRSVWLEDVPAARLASVEWTPLDVVGRLRGLVRVVGAEGGGWSVRAEFAHRGTPLGALAVDVRGGVVEFTVRLGDTHTVDTPELLWSPDNPALVDVTLTLLRDGVEVDRVASYTGLRTVVASGDAITLNGRRLFLRLVLEQAYWPDTHFTAPDAAALRAEARLIRDLGFNGLRMHQTSADPRFLRACDELGLVVWADAPASYAFSTASLTRTTHTLTELIERDRNHPSVIAWVPFNESWGLDVLAGEPRQRWAVVGLHGLAKALDPTRLVLGNDGWEHVCGDVVGVHDYSHDPDELSSRYGTRAAVGEALASGRVSGLPVVLGHPEGTPEPTRPVVLSEFGGVSLDGGGAAWSGYGGVADADALVAQVRALAGAVRDGSGVAGFCWTQLTDTLQEQNGLTWPDRTPKAPAAVLAAAIRGLEPPPSGADTP